LTLVFPLHRNRDCNIAKQGDYPVLAEWTDEKKAAALSRVPDLLGRALLWKLLSKDPKLRPATMAEVLRHPFFFATETDDDSVTPADGKVKQLFFW
jgi:hypothetical protein